MPALRDAYRNVRRPLLRIARHRRPRPTASRAAPDRGHRRVNSRAGHERHLGEVTAHLRRFVKYLTDSEKAKAAQRKMASNATIERPWLLKKLHNAQSAIRTFVEEELTGAFCVCELLREVRDLRVVAAGEETENTM